MSIYREITTKEGVKFYVWNNELYLVLYFYRDSNYIGNSYVNYFCKGNYYHDKGILSLTIIPALLLMACLAIEPFLANYNMSNQSENNIRTAIKDNYNNAENIAVKSDSGYFSSDNENYSFEVIDDTLIIKNGETIVKYISGDNY